MSKSARKHRPSPPPGRHPVKKHAPPPKKTSYSPEQREKAKRIVGIAAVVILAGIPFSIGKYFEFNSFDPFDSGAYIHSAARILAGAEIGVDEKPSAQLGTLLVNILGVRLFGYNETGPKLIQTLFQAAALVLMFIALRRLYGTLPAAVGVIVASMYLSWAFIAKTGNVKEQYMIACMVIGVSCFTMYELSGKWWQALVAGAVLSWAPLFKQTGVTAIGAIGLFVMLQPILKHQTWKQTGRDILLLFGGAFAGIVPLYIWMLGWGVKMALPYAFVWQTLAGFIPSGAEAEQAKVASNYVTRSREFVPFSIQYRKVMYHYGKVIMPIALACTAIVIGVVRWIMSLLAKKQASRAPYDRFFLLFAVWWILDMAFVWISPRSYVQYYLPLNASAAMLGAYGVAVYWDGAKRAEQKTKWLMMGIVGLFVMVFLSWHVFFDTASRSSDSYQYMLRTAALRRKGLAPNRGEGTGEYIRTHSKPTDRIYVWGWIPGIYVKAQRFSAASRACCLPRPAPAVLKDMVDELLAEFKENMPKFIVDTRKHHIPVERPPYELWPIVRYQGMKHETFLSPDENAVAAYEKSWAEMLRRDFGDKEAERFEVLAPFRKFIRENYEIVGLNQYMATRDGVLYHPVFGEEVLFERKEK
jgi:hypothetical protein